MRTEAQINASRLNGAKSRGPVTDAGKLASSQNALKHGMLASRVLLKDECPEVFDALASELYDEFLPTTPFERSLVDDMILARWRQERIGLIERANLELQMAAERDNRREANLDPETLSGLAFRTLANETRVLDLISRYEARYERQYLRAHKRLMEIRQTNPTPGPLPPVIAIDTPRPIQADVDVAPDMGAPAILSPVPSVPFPIPPNEPEPDGVNPLPSAADSRSHDNEISPIPLPRAA